jgi:hypothetical protein
MRDEQIGQAKLALDRYAQAAVAQDLPRGVSPGLPDTPPPGWVPAPHIYRPLDRCAVDRVPRSGRAAQR